MDDATFLASYDPAAFPPLAVAVDVVPLTFTNSALCVLLNKRTELPARGRLALPGTFVRADEELGAAAQRALRDKAGLNAPVRQFHAFGAVARDPRMRIVSVGYMAVVDAEIMGRASARRCVLPLWSGSIFQSAMCLCPTPRSRPRGRRQDRRCATSFVQGSTCSSTARAALAALGQLLRGC